jgi:hypothetical protein
MIRQAFRWLAALGMLGAALWSLWFAVLRSPDFTHRDITVFWAAERLFLHHQNP